MLILGISNSSQMMWDIFNQNRKQNDLRLVYITKFILHRTNRLVNKFNSKVSAFECKCVCMPCTHVFSVYLYRRTWIINTYIRQFNQTGALVKSKKEKEKNKTVGGMVFPGCSNKLPSASQGYRCGWVPPWKRVRVAFASDNLYIFFKRKKEKMEREGRLQKAVRSAITKGVCLSHPLFLLVFTLVSFLTFSILLIKTHQTLNSTRHALFPPTS